MMNNKQRQQLSKYINIVIRRKTMIITLVFIAIISGLASYLSMPRIYQSSALLSYQQQKINPSKMSPDVEAKIRDMVSTLSQIVTSRTNLEKTIKNLDLFVRVRKNVSMEDVVDLMREKIDIKPSKRGDTFRVSYMGSDPGKVVKVTNALAAKFIEENLKYREERATETSAYTTEELQMAKVVMDRNESAMRDYKLQYYNEMPEQRTSNVERLTALQLQYQAKQDSIQDLERTKVLVQEQISTRRKILEQASTLEENLENDSLKVRVEETSWQRLARMKKVRDVLLLKYTDKHPEVKRINRFIANLEKEVSGTVEEVGQGEETQQIITDSTILELGMQLKSISLNIQSLDREKGQLKKQIQEYEKWVAAAPVREAEWSALTREYGELKRHYDYLVAQNLQASSILNLERKQRGSQFKIEDPARLPEKPMKPDFLIVMGIAIAAGLALGGGLAFGNDMLDFSFKDPTDIETFLDLPVVCSVPYIRLADEERKDKMKFVVGLSIFLFSLVAVLALFIFCWRKGLIVI